MNHQNLFWENLFAGHIHNPKGSESIVHPAQTTRRETCKFIQCRLKRKAEFTMSFNNYAKPPKGTRFIPRSPPTDGWENAQCLAA